MATRSFERLIPWLRSVGCVMTIMLSCVAVQAQPTDAAGHLSRWAIDTNDPSSSVPSDEDLAREPLQGGYFLMDLTGDAEKAMRRQDFAQAIKYFKAVQKMVPERAISYAKECECQQALGQRALALEACKTAMNREGVRIADAARYVHLLTSAPAGPTAAELDELNAVLAHLRKENVDLVALSQIECDLAIQLDDEPRLKTCTAALDAKAPKDPKTVPYLWALAIKQGNYADAKRLLARGREAGMAPAALEKMLEGTRSIRWAWLTNRPQLVFGGLLLGCLGVAGWYFSRRSGLQTPRQIASI